MRQEHVHAEFGLFDRIRPLKSDSQRAWRFLWNPLFYELCNSVGGVLRFNLNEYRKLDPAARRMFLLTRKLLHRRDTTQWFDPVQLAVNQLGYSENIESRFLKRKVLAVTQKLVKRGFIQPISEDVGTVLDSDGSTLIRFRRGEEFHLMGSGDTRNQLPIDRLPEYSQLQRIGVRQPVAQRVIRDYPGRLVREWCEITIAAMEQGHSFTTSPAAYFMHYLKEAASGSTSAPDWWHDFRKREQQQEAARHRQRSECLPVNNDREEQRRFAEFLRAECKTEMEELAHEFAEYSSSPELVRRRIADEARIRFMPRFRRLKHTTC